MAALLAFIIVAFLMTTLGVALLCLGEVPFIAGKRIPAVRSRLIGLVLFAFAPLALGVRQGINAIFGPDAVDAQAVTWSLFGFCWFVAFMILFRVMVPKRAPRKPTKAATTSAAKNPFGAAPVGESNGVEKAEGEKKTPAKKKTPAPAAESLPWMDAEPEPPPKQKEPAKKASGKKAPGPPAKEENPFDFS